jgi:hypothetical protein
MVAILHGAGFDTPCIVRPRRGLNNVEAHIVLRWTVIIPRRKARGAGAWRSRVDSGWTRDY